MKQLKLEPRKKSPLRRLLMLKKMHSKLFKRRLMLKKLSTHTELFQKRKRIKRPPKPRIARKSLIFRLLLTKLLKINLKLLKRLLLIAKDQKMKKLDLIPKLRELKNRLMNPRKNLIKSPKNAKISMKISRKLLMNQRKRLKN